MAHSPLIPVKPYKAEQYDTKDEVSCGMKHDPLGNNYFMKAIVDANDLRSIFFVPVQGKFKIAKNRKLCKINS